MERTSYEKSKEFRWQGPCTSASRILVVIKCFRSLQLAIVAPSSIPDVAMLSGQDEMRWNGSFLHSWWLSARWFACGCFIWPPSIMSRAFYDLKRRCLATKNHPIWLIGLSSRELKHLLTLGKRQDLGVYQCTNPIWHQLYFPLSLRFQPTPGYKEDATTQRFFSAGLTEESVSFGSLQVSQWDEWPFGRGKTLRVPGDEN